MKKNTAPTAADVRAMFRSNEKRTARLSPEAQKTVAPGARGRLHPEVIRDFNRGRKPQNRYELGATKASVAMKAAQRAKAAQSGVKVGKRGPLSKEALAALKG